MYKCFFLSFVGLKASKTAAPYISVLRLKLNLNRKRKTNSCLSPVSKLSASFQPEKQFVWWLSPSLIKSDHDNLGFSSLAHFFIPCRVSRSELFDVGWNTDFTENQMSHFISWCYLSLKKNYWKKTYQQNIWSRDSWFYWTWGEKREHECHWSPQIT